MGVNAIKYKEWMIRKACESWSFCLEDQDYPVIVFAKKKKIKNIMNTKLVLQKKFKAFTLAEILVVLIIIGILVLLALPNLMPLISKAKSTEAQLQLNHVYTLEKTYFYLYSKYTNNLEEIGFEQEPLVSDGGSANYEIEVVDYGPNYFKAKAISVVDFDSDGIFNEWEINQDKNLKEIVKD